MVEGPNEGELRVTEKLAGWEFCEIQQRRVQLCVSNSEVCKVLHCGSVEAREAPESPEQYRTYFED